MTPSTETWSFGSASKTLMVMEFERSTWVSRPALTPIRSNVLMDQDAKKRTWRQSLKEEFVAMRKCMRHYFG